MFTKIEDLKYLCTNLGNLSGIPVRLFHYDKEILYYSTINLIKDPFELDKDSIFNLKEKITYYQSSFNYYYGIINHKGNKVIFGPTSQIKLSNQELKSISFSLGIPMSETDEFISQMRLISSLPLMTLLEILGMIYFSMTGTKISLESLSIHESAQSRLREEMEKESISKNYSLNDSLYMGPYNALDTENRIMDMIMRGDTSALKLFIKNIPSIRSGRIAEEELRQHKNIFIVTTTLVSRSAIRGGMDITTSLLLSDSYIQKCELAKDIETITDLNYLMVLDYAERVEKIRFGKDTSKLIIDVSNYIQNHLSDPIKTDDIANALFISRSRLSTLFKTETGINLSDYITIQKIDEAKRLLRYSDKPFTSIAIYLGFSSHSHFTKVFKKITSYTPSEYRQLHKHY